MKWLKHEAPSPIVANPSPVIRKMKVPWITKWVTARRLKKSKNIDHSKIQAHPKHCIKPLRKVRPVKFFYSSNVYKRLAGMKKLKDLPSYR